MQAAVSISHAHLQLACWQLTPFIKRRSHRSASYATRISYCCCMLLRYITDIIYRRPEVLMDSSYNLMRRHNES